MAGESKSSGPFKRGDIVRYRDDYMGTNIFVAIIIDVKCECLCLNWIFGPVGAAYRAAHPDYDFEASAGYCEKLTEMSDD